MLQAADILIYKATAVPVGVDQAPHIELTREIARRFNATYRPIFPEPQTLLTETPKILGTDGRKMSKSYGNAVYLTEPPEDVDRKLSRMVTDPRRARRTDPGEPDGLPGVHCRSTASTARPRSCAWQEEGCRTASIGCLECKKIMIKHVLAELEPIRARRAELTADDARAVLAAGNARARAGRGGDDGRGARRDGARMSAAPCTVKLDVFEGPLDLLLHLIKKNEVQITDIPIAAHHRSVPRAARGAARAQPRRRRRVPRDGGDAHVHQEPDAAAASTRTTRTRPRSDPRAELVQQLLEYQRFREAAADLGERRVLGRDVFAAAGEPSRAADPGDAGSAACGTRAWRICSTRCAASSRG